MHRLSQVLLFFAFAALLSGTANSAPQRSSSTSLGTLAGTVVGPSGRPVPDARVTMQDAAGVHPHAVETNAQGRFFFPLLKPGLYDARAYFNGVWSEWAHNVPVRRGKQAEVKLQLPRKSAPAKKAAHSSGSSQPAN
ncbi:MAG: carboxypeptidase-like regulatory domain-containing protein [Candidatus Acidiferrales bacterium]|jgi:hypothetical protein